MKPEVPLYVCGMNNCRATFEDIRSKLAHQKRRHEGNEEPEDDAED